MTEGETAKQYPGASSVEKACRKEMADLLRASPIPPEEICANLGLYMRRQTLMETLALAEIYKRILTVPGVVIEAGTRWGRKMATLMSLRGIYEPYNVHRRIVGFDTFSGFSRVTANDGDAPVIRVGAFSTVPGYRDYLETVLSNHEQESPISHVRRFELHRGDIAEALPRYLAINSEVAIALMYFDLDLYEPTRKALECVIPRLVKGSVIAFDDFGHPEFPGETRALMDVLGLRCYPAELIPGHSQPTFFTVC